ncbi:PR-1-like protein [Trematosphaeria pertusa]|uniref:PR-1-like protein n=1 Tax=Trematosphaeria pertusa TaxID=390896 RepID=A0A6A6ILF8_9PLEO|nr:PR-1-like protein [Trematosphaeria pertusa]KAF2251047.1 PR-1-like protein [Trematosphaeria pertusa]
MKLSAILALAAAHGVAAAPAKGVEARAQVDGAAPHVDDPKFIGIVMDAHWFWRKVHCAQDLVWNATLAQEALESVSVCTHGLQHDRGGSNLSGVGPSPGNYDAWIEFARNSIHGWHEEERLYPYSQPHYNDAWGHFSQMVWRDSSQIGCALGHCKDSGDGAVQWPGRIYCFYLRAGNNFAGNQFELNVFRPVCAPPSRQEMERRYGY